MKNLYKAINVARHAKASDIRKAIDRVVEPALKRDASKVLLNPESKAVYDRNHVLLIRISEVRQAFGLTESDSWDKEIQREFFPKRPPIVRTVFCTIAVLIVDIDLCFEGIFILSPIDQ